MFQPNSIKRIHLIGICGTAMASLAGMLESQGFEVTGSDQNIYPPMSTLLERLGIRLLEGYKAEHLSAARPDLVVVGNAISRGNPEAEQVLNQRIRYASLPEVLKEFFIRGRQSIVVAGTHGKTTTTSLLAWLLEYAGLNPGFLIGGVAENFDSSFRVTNGKIFVIEGDEYDTAFFDKGPKFLHYLPDWVIFNNCEYDHADIYPDFEAVKTSFRRLLNIIPQAGRLFAGWDDATVQELSSRAFCPIVSFGLAPKTQWNAGAIKYGEQTTRFEVIKQGAGWGTVEVPLGGSFNVKNVLAAIACADELGVPASTIAEALRQFKNVKRRLEVRGAINDITIYDDFAHHPTAIRETIGALRARHPQARLWAIFEPRSATSRRNTFQKEFAGAFNGASQVVLCSPFAPEKLDPAKRLDVEALVQAMRSQGIAAEHWNTAAEIVEAVVPRLLPGDQVLIMSNGGFDGIHQKMMDRLQGRLRHALK